MKKYYLTLFAFLITAVSFAQSNIINYKALIKDTSGNVVANQTIPFSIAIIKTDPNTGSVVYSENHNVTTDANGIVMLNIGGGTTDFGIFETIDWSSDRHFLLTGTDLGAGPISFGATEFNSVPYALSSGDKVFSTSANITSNTNGDLDNDDFVFGSTQLDDTSGGSDNLRMFFDKSKGAFRVGAASSSQWNTTNVGSYSFATGINNTASGVAAIAFGNGTDASGAESTAMGKSTTASGFESTAMGFGTLASGNKSTAMGNGTNATGAESTTMGKSTTASGPIATAMGESTVASGVQSTAMGFSTRAQSRRSLAVGYYNIGGGNPTSYISTDPLFEIGNGANENNRSNALTILKNGTITAPSFDLAEITNNKALVTKEYVDSNSGPFSTTSNVTSNANGNIDTDDFVFGSTQLDHNKPEFENDTRIFFDKSKGAFRTGSTANFNNDPNNGTAWDNTNIGLNSFASGTNTVASGQNSVAMGTLSIASGIHSSAIGFRPTASGAGSIAIGNTTTASGNSSFASNFGTVASGDFSTAMGIETRAEAFASMAIGRYNIGGGNATQQVSTDPIFEIGNGTNVNNRSNALTILKNGATTINGSTTAIETTASSTVPAIRGIKQHTGNVDAIGVLGENTVSDFYGIGVRGTAGWIGVQGLVTGTGSGTYSGVIGVSEGVNSGTNYGVFGSASNASTNYAVYANGDMAYSGTLTNVSDRTLKTNIRQLNNALETIKALQPSQYSFKESYQKSINVSSRPQFGFIAQELQTVLPDLVSQNIHPSSSKEEQPKTYLGVNYIGLIPILTAGIQEQQEKMETLEEKVTTQQQIIETLLARVEALENN